jgi:hypothetical protein
MSMDSSNVNAGLTSFVAERDTIAAKELQQLVLRGIPGPVLETETGENAECKVCHSKQCFSISGLRISLRPARCTFSYGGSGHEFVACRI